LRRSTAKRRPYSCSSLPGKVALVSITVLTDVGRPRGSAFRAAGGLNPSMESCPSGCSRRGFRSRSRRTNARCASSHRPLAEETSFVSLSSSVPTPASQQGSLPGSAGRVAAPCARLPNFLPPSRNPFLFRPDRRHPCAAPPLTARRRHFFRHLRLSRRSSRRSRPLPLDNLVPSLEVAAPPASRGPDARVRRRPCLQSDHQRSQRQSELEVPSCMRPPALCDSSLTSHFSLERLVKKQAVLEHHASVSANPPSAQRRRCKRRGL